MSISSRMAPSLSSSHSTEKRNERHSDRPTRNIQVLCIFFPTHTANLSLDTRALHPVISPLGSGGTGLLGTESSWLSEGSPSEKSEWAVSSLPPPPPPLQMQSAHMAHLHLWGRFRLKSSQRFRLYDKSRSRLSWRERAGAFASLPPDNSFIRLKERFAAA